MGGWSLIRLRWEGLRLYRRYGWPLPVVVLTAVLAVIIGWQGGLRSREGNALAAELAHGASRPLQRPVEQYSADSLQQFYQSLPAEGERFAFLKAILLAAEKHRVLPPSADYKLRREPHTRLVRYQLTLPVEGRWGDMQGFLKTVLSAHRSAVIDALSLKRDGGDAERIEGRLRISILMVRTERETAQRQGDRTSPEGQRR